MCRAAEVHPAAVPPGPLSSCETNMQTTIVCPHKHHRSLLQTDDVPTQSAIFQSDLTDDGNVVRDTVVPLQVRAAVALVGLSCFVPGLLSSSLWNCGAFSFFDNYTD